MSLYSIGTAIEQAVNDLRWMLNVRRARAFRRKMIFSRRRAFDAAARHPMHGVAGSVVAYPDSFYLMDMDDVIRGLDAAWPEWEAAARMAGEAEAERREGL